MRGRVLGWSDLDFSSKHAIACWTSTTSLSLVSQLVWSLQTKSRSETWEQKARVQSSTSTRSQTTARIEVELRTWAFCSGFVRKLQASTAGSRDLVVDVQQAMACIALTFHPGTICFELKSRSDQHRTPSPHAGSSNSQWQLTQTVRPQNEMVGYFIITASLDYDCAVVAGSVHVCKVVISAWDQSILSLPVSPRNSLVPRPRSLFFPTPTTWPGYEAIRGMSPFRSPFRVLQ